MADEIITSVASNYDVVAYEGDDFDFSLVVKNEDGTDFDFTDYTAKMHVRKRRVESDPLILAFTTDSEITLSSGSILIKKSSEDMGNVSGDYFYDLKMVDADGLTTTWLFGKFIIHPTVTT